MAKVKLDIPKDLSKLPDVFREILEAKTDRLLDKYVKNLVKTMNWLALSILTQRGDGRVLTFTSRRKGKEIRIRPSDMALFRELELGTFDAEGKLVNPPHSVIREVKVFLDSHR